MKQTTGRHIAHAIVVALLLAATAQAQEKKDAPKDEGESVPRFEVGAEYSSLSVNYPEDFVGTAYHVGFGGRFTFNLNPHVAVEAEGDFFPNETALTVSAGSLTIGRTKTPGGTSTSTSPRSLRSR